MVPHPLPVAEDADVELDRRGQPVGQDVRLQLGRVDEEIAVDDARAAVRMVLWTTPLRAGRSTLADLVDGNEPEAELLGERDNSRPGGTCRVVGMAAPHFSATEIREPAGVGFSAPASPSRNSGRVKAEGATLGWAMTTLGLMVIRAPDRGPPGPSSSIPSRTMRSIAAGSYAGARRRMTLAGGGSLML